MRSLLEIQKCTSIEKSQCLCGFPLLSGCTSMPRSCTLPLILVHLYNNENPSVYAGLRHCCTLSYSKPGGPWPDWTSRLLAFRKGGSLRKSRVETSKVFSQVFFKKLAERETASRDPKGVARGAAPAFPYFPKGGTYVPLLGWHRARSFACGRGGLGASAPGPRPMRCVPCGRCPAFLSPAAPVKAVERCSTPRKPLKRLERNFYAASRGDSLKNCLYQIKKAYTVHTRRLLSALPFLWSSSSFTSFSVWKNFWAFSPKNSSLTML